MVTGSDSYCGDGQPLARCDGLRISAEPGASERGLIVSISGELDIFNADSLVDAVGGLELDGDRTVVLDLTGLTFCDAAGVSALLTTNRFLRHHGRRLKIHGISGMPRRVLSLTGADHVLEVE